MVRRTTVKKLRNLPQYKDYSEEELQKIADSANVRLVADEKINQLMKKFAEDYDLDAMNINDKLALEVLCGIYLQIHENLGEIELAKRKKNWKLIDQLIDVNKSLVGNISTLEKQLGISRTARGKDKESSVFAYIDGLREKAQRFLEEKLRYFYCPKCSMLLATMWFLYPEENNQIHFTCGRCKKEITYFTDEFCSTEETSKVIQERPNE